MMFPAVFFSLFLGHRPGVVFLNGFKQEELEVWRL